MLKSKFNIAELIAKSRDSLELSEDEICFIVQSIVSRDMSDAQVGAFAMAVLCKGMTSQNGVILTKAMRDSGQVLQWDVAGPVIDKHSTGGVGDGVSLLLAPILAACGGYVPMISGRGLGHTGGTLDKLEAIEGFSTQISVENMQTQLVGVGCVMAGQGPNLVPADGRLYGIRDVTATVPSIDLITASILSKKLAAGLDYLVLDVKCGLGAFMKTPTEAKRLASRLVEVAGALGCPTRALITDMNKPLAENAGNAVEVVEVIEYLDGSRKQGDFLTITKALCAEVLQSCGICKDQEEAIVKIETALNSGHVAERFERMCAAQGGRAKLTEIQKALPKAAYVKDIVLPKGVEFYGFDAYKIGMTVVKLGGGRQNHTDRIDYSVGVSAIASHANSGDVIATVHAKNESDFEYARSQILGAIFEEPLVEKLILDRII